MIRECHVCNKKFNDKFAKAALVEKEDGEIQTIYRVRLNSEDPPRYVYLCKKCIVPYINGAIDALNMEYKKISLEE